VQLVVTQPGKTRVHGTELLVTRLFVPRLFRLAVHLLRTGHRVDRLLVPEVLTRRRLVRPRVLVPGTVITGVGVAGIAVAEVVWRRRLLLVAARRATPLPTEALVRMTLVTVLVTPVTAGRAGRPRIDVRVVVPLVAGLDERAILAAVELCRTETLRP
jgi:hypothetical protein